jgi:hypothetical protein
MEEVGEEEVLTGHPRIKERPVLSLPTALHVPLVEVEVEFLSKGLDGFRRVVATD